MSNIQKKSKKLCYYLKLFSVFQFSVFSNNEEVFLYKKKIFTKQIQGTLVPKLTLGPILTLSVRNGHKLKDWVFWIKRKSL